MAIIEAVSFFIGMGVGVLTFILASSGGWEIRKEVLEAKIDFDMEMSGMKLHNRGVNHRLEALEQVVFSPQMREKLGNVK